jgi:hypothetical protein
MSATMEWFKMDTLSFSRARVLLVGSNLQVRTSLARVLTSLQFQVHEVSSVGEARVVSYDLDFLICEWKLSDGLAPEVVSHHQSRLGPLPFLIVSGSYPPLPRGYPFLLKPFTLEQLRGKMSACWNLHRQSSQQPGRAPFPHSPL